MKKILLASSLFAVSTFAQAVDLHLYAGAGLKVPVDQIIQQFEKETGNKVSVEYGGSGQILARYKTVNQGDLFLPGSEDYVEKLEKLGKVSAQAPVVLHVPVMAVRKDKGENINSFKDLAESNLRLGIGDSKAMALGKGAEKMLELSGYGKELNDKIVTKAATVKQLMLYLVNGDVDAAVVGRAGAWKMRNKVKMLPIPKGTPEEKVTIALLSTSQHPKEAQALFNFIKSQQGVKYFTDEGFLPLP